MTRIVVAIAGLLISEPAWSAEPWHGRWSIDPIGCTVEGDTSETAPLFATATTLKWFVADCKISRIYKTDAGIHIQARCSAEGKTGMTPIGLKPVGDRLRVTWNRTRVKDMRRCK